MSDASTHKTEFAKLINTDIQDTSNDFASAKEFLIQEGVNVDRLIADGLKRIKKMQLQAEAEKNRIIMSSLDKYVDRAKEMAQQLLASPTFSFLDYINAEQMVASFSNLQKLTDEEKLSVIEKHITLKLQKEAGESNGL